MAKDYDYLLKVLLVGDSDVGKHEIMAGLEDASSESPFCSRSGNCKYFYLNFSRQSFWLIFSLFLSLIVLKYSYRIPIAVIFIMHLHRPLISKWNCEKNSLEINVYFWLIVIHYALSSQCLAYKTTTILLDGKRVRLQLWDTSGQGRFCTIIRSYSRGAQGVILVYDITNKWSFDGIDRWLKEVEEVSHTKSVRTSIRNIHNTHTPIEQSPAQTNWI